MPSSEVMHKWKHGSLRSGSGGKVTSRKQAIAIMMSERRKEAAHGGKYPEADEGNDRAAIQRRAMKKGKKKED